MRYQPSSTCDIGLVIIGEDGGEGLLRRLDEWLTVPHRIVYADPQLTEELARFLDNCGIQCVSSKRLSGRSRAACRNEAMREMYRLGPRPISVQWLRQESRLSEGWLREASRYLAMNPRVGLVSGRVHLADQKTARHRLQAARCNGPSGNSCTFPSEALVRTDAFEIIAGFHEQVESLEETEFVDRLGFHGWEATRIGVLMTQCPARSSGWREWLRQQYRLGYQESSLLAYSYAAEVRFSRRHRWDWVLTSIVGLGSVAGLFLNGKLTAACVLSIVFFFTGWIKMVLHPQQPPASLLRQSDFSIADGSVLGISTALRMCGEVVYVFSHFKLRWSPRCLRFLGTYQPPMSKHRVSQAHASDRT